MPAKATNRQRLRNIGISAHVDSGKTTLSERILFYSGKIHTMVEVGARDGGSATLDSTPEEQAGGITIQSAATTVAWGDHVINLIDTPGHVDFTIEVERALRVLDGAVLVLCAVSGVQSQSITVDRQMRRYRVPCLAFVNKCDLAGADPLRVCADLRSLLGHNAVMIQHPIGLEGEHEGVVDLISREAIRFAGEDGRDVVRGEVPAELREVVEAQRQLLVEALAELDDEIARRFLEDEEVPAELIVPALRAATLARQLTPVCCGSAYRNKGVQPLLDDVVRYLPSPLDQEYEGLDLDADEAPVRLVTDPQRPLAMLAFKVKDSAFGQLTYCRIYQGALRKGDRITNTISGERAKVGDIYQMHADKRSVVEEALAGDIVALQKLECASGDTFTDGAQRLSMRSMFVPDPVVDLAIRPLDKTGRSNLSKALNRFCKEDPTFRVRQDPESNETIVSGMGELHLEIYLKRLAREYGVEVEVSAPRVAYRETITRRAPFDLTHAKQSGGSGEWARVAGHIEPIEPVEGEPPIDYEFVDRVVGGAIERDYISSCDKGFRAACERGSLIEAPVVGVRCEINDGATHSKDSSDRAFQTAARLAFRAAYPEAQPVVLEPLMTVCVEGPEAFAGPILGGLNRRRGLIVANTVEGVDVRVTATVPLEEMFGYANDLRSTTEGKASFTMEFARYAAVPGGRQAQLVADHQRSRES